MPDSSQVFVDTSGWIAILNRNDQLRDLAIPVWEEMSAARRPVVTTDWVIAETLNGLARSPARQQVVQAVRTLLSSPRCRFVCIDEALFERALDMYGQRSGQRCGLVDCASFLVMRDLEILDALTADRDFEQAGYNRLLRTP